VAIPFYVLYDADQKVLATYPGLTRNSSEYLTFLNTRATVPSVASAQSSAGLDGLPFHTMDGTAISTADWKGKVVVLNYWATWCIPCRAEIPEFNRMDKELEPNGVKVVGIAVDDEGAPIVRKFLKDHPIGYTLGLSAGMGSLYELPVTIVLDRSGNTVQRFNGLTPEGEIRAAIEKAQNAGA